MELKGVSPILVVFNGLGFWNPLWNEINLYSGPVDTFKSNNCCHSLHNQSPVPLNHAISSTSNLIYNYHRFLMYYQPPFWQRSPKPEYINYVTVLSQKSSI